MRAKVLWLLSVYIDFIFVSAVVGVAVIAAGEAVEALVAPEFAFLVEWGVSLVLVALGRVLGVSLGKWLLSYARQEVEAGSAGRLWPNLALGTLLMLEGLKGMVRWTELGTTMPAFGLVETTALKIVLLLASGALNVLAGAMLVAFATGAKRVATLSIALIALSLALSWRILPEAVERTLLVRRALEGRPIREGEIEFMQMIVPPFTAAMLAVCLLLVYLSRERT